MTTIYAQFEDTLDGGNIKTVEVGKADDPRAISAIVHKLRTEGLSAECTFRGGPAKVYFAPRCVLAVIAAEGRILNPVPDA